MINRIILVGRLTRDPELRYTPSGAAVTKFNIAVDRKYTNQKGERETDFIPIVVWQKLAENCANYLAKGSLVGVDGRLQINQYEKEGQTHRSPQVVAEDVRFLDRKKDGDGSQKQKQDDPFAGIGTEVNYDDLPF
ncbi:single-stranded DNA-binding protein [Risungbinella massiliensis]|uniref:single-stranded DNA-binding protein n=1 Tax=Risungbinella massiliensis TaxID=1329796 RepID=UPI0005CC7A82|nr:single-stranded DNA-binding protein [Risungbinella massiliensis]